MSEILAVGQDRKNIEIKTQKLKGGVTQISFASFDDMGLYYKSRLEEFVAKDTRVDCVGIAMFIFEKPVVE